MTSFRAAEISAGIVASYRLVTTASTGINLLSSRSAWGLHLRVRLQGLVVGVDAQIVGEAWRVEYNTFRPHSALDGLTPDQYAKTWTQQQQPKLPQ